MTDLTLTLTGTAFMKLMYLMKKTTMEVSGYGISSRNNLFHITDFRMPKQEGQAAHTELTEDGIANHFDKALAEGLEPVEFARIWVHTHPKGVNGPSGTDEATMRNTFGQCDWAIMLILTQGEHFHCELWTKKLGGIALGEHLRLPMKVQIDWSTIENIDTAAWDREFTDSFTEKTYSYNTGGKYNWKTGLFEYDYQKKTDDTTDLTRTKLKDKIEHAHDLGLLGDSGYDRAIKDMGMGLPTWQIQQDVQDEIQSLADYPALCQGQPDLFEELQLALNCQEITQEEFDHAVSLAMEGKELPVKIKAILYGSPYTGEAEKDQLYELFTQGKIDEYFYNKALSFLENNGHLSIEAQTILELEKETPFLYD